MKTDDEKIATKDYNRTDMQYFEAIYYMLQLLLLLENSLRSLGCV